MNNIIQQQTETTISDRTVLESELADAKFNVELAFADKVRYHLNDTLPSSQDSALNTIKLAGFADANCQLIAAQVASSNNTLTASIIDEMHGGVQNVDGFCKFQKMIIELNQSVQKCFVMKTDAGLKTSVESIANDKTADGYCQAQALLKEVFNYSYPVLRLVPSQNGSRFGNSDENNNTSIEVSNNQILQLYPNPTSSKVSILLKGQGGENNLYQLDIRNTLGQLLLSKTIEENKTEELAVDDLLNGLYLISLSQNNKLIKETKLVIMK